MLNAGDYDLSTFDTSGGTVIYTSPELLNEDAQGAPVGVPSCAAHHQAADIWGAACTAYRVLTNDLIFWSDPGQPLEDQKAEVRQQQAELVRVPAVTHKTAQARHCAALKVLIRSAWSSSMLHLDCHGKYGNISCGDHTLLLIQVACNMIGAGGAFCYLHSKNCP